MFRVGAFFSRHCVESFNIFPPNVVKISHNFELYHFKVGEFLRHSGSLYFLAKTVAEPLG